VVDVAELRSVPLFGGLASDDLAMLAERADLVEAEAAGVDLTREGDFGHCVFAIVDGTAAVTVDGAPVRDLGPGDLFGEIAVLAAGRRTATVTSSSPMRLVSLFKRDLWRLADERPEFDAALRAVTARGGDEAA
jgi:CRP/FNR family transcriptional regulator, cyclic AMP receptor protein